MKEIRNISNKYLYPNITKKTIYIKDEFDEIGGILNKYANKSKQSVENKAWELHIRDKYK